MGLRHREKIEVNTDGRQIDVWNFLNVSPAYQFRGGNPTKEAFPDAHIIETGGGGRKPNHVTQWVAAELRHELSIDVKDHDIEIIDIESDDVTVV